MLPWIATGALAATLPLLWPLRHQAGAALALLVNAALMPAPLLWRRRRPDAGAGEPRSVVIAPPSPAPSLAPSQPADDTLRHELLLQLSREVRTPLNAIMGMTQLALQTALTAEQRGLLQQADAASQALLGLLRDALDVAALQSGQAQVARHPMRLDDVIAQAMERVRPAHVRPDVALLCRWNDARLLGTHGALLGDAARLQQVLVTLLANALKFTLQGQVELVVDTLPVQVDDGIALRLVVQDTGIGMSAAQLAAAFPADSAQALRPPTGAVPQLGLGQTQRLVQLMGGRLQADSQPGRGTHLELMLPLALDAQGQPAPALAPQRVLLALADGPERDAHHALLQQLAPGATLRRCDTAGGTLTALADAQRAGTPFQSLLLDWRLPGPGARGLDLLAVIRRDHPALRVALLASPGPDDEWAQAARFGAPTVLPAPLLPTELRDWLNTPDDRPTPNEAQPLQGLRVLLVEDHPLNRDIAQRLLLSAGAQVHTAADGQQGLDWLGTRQPKDVDVVLMDLHMPVLDGLSATRQLKRLPGFDRLPVLAMTAATGAEERDACHAAGMQGHITKPLDMALLVRTLQAYRPAPPPAPAELPLDRALGMRQFDGHAALYERTLNAFADQYAAGLAPWSAWLQAGEWAELRRAAHTLQGLAATLGARPLHRAALALELGAAAADAVRAEPLLADTATALAALQADMATAAPARTPPAEFEPPAHTPADLATLEALLSQSDSQALDWWQTHGAHAAVSADTREQVGAALALMDFDAAAEALRHDTRSPA